MPLCLKTPIHTWASHKLNTWNPPPPTPTMEDRSSNDTYQKSVLFHSPVSQAALISYTSFSTDAIPLNLTSEMRLMTSFVTVSNKALLMFNGDLTSLFSN